MLTLCWSAKGGSGTTVVAAGIALAASTPTLLVDLVGGLPTALGLPDPAGPGVADWLASNAAPARLASLELTLAGSLSLLRDLRDRYASGDLGTPAYSLAPQGRYPAGTATQIIEAARGRSSSAVGAKEHAPHEFARYPLSPQHRAYPFECPSSSAASPAG